MENSVAQTIFKNINKNERNELLKDLSDHMDNQYEIINDLREKLDNYNKDEEIQKLQNEIDELRRKSIMILSDKEIENIKEFSHNHYKSCKGRIRYIIEGNGIGKSTQIQCLKCGEILDVTDYDMW